MAFWMFMTNLWHVKRNDFLHFETLKCPEIYLKLCPEISLPFCGLVGLVNRFLIGTAMCVLCCCCDRAAAMTLRTVLLSLQALLAAAEPDDPQDAVVAAQYKDAPEIFNKTARHWANVYANGMSIQCHIISQCCLCNVYISYKIADQPFSLLG